MKNFYNVADVTTSAVGVGYGVHNLYEWLGVVVLVLSIANILFKAGILIYDKIKSKKIKDIPQIIDNTIEQLEEVHKDE